MSHAVRGPQERTVGLQDEQDLPPRDAPPHGVADGWGDVNHLDDVYLEFSTASSIPRGPILFLGVLCVLFSGVLLNIPIEMVISSGEWEWGLMGLVVVPLLVMSAFFFRLDLTLPKDRPVRFNRRRRQVFVSYYEWSHNPFGNWQARAKVVEWDLLHAEITKQWGVSGELVMQRHSLDLVVLDPQAETELDRLRLQKGSYTTKQFEQQWEYIRQFMRDGPASLPSSQQLPAKPAFLDCLLFAVPWLSPTTRGRAARQRMDGLLWFMAALMMTLLPLWFAFGLCNYLVIRLAPEAIWPQDMDALSKS